MASVGGGKSESDAKSQQGIRGTSLFEPVQRGMQQSWDTGLGISQQAANSPFGFFRGQKVGLNTGGPNDIAPTGRYGASAAIDTGLSGIMNDKFNQVSSSAARRGQLSPESTAGVVGSAGAEWAKTAAPMIQQWQQYITELPSKLWSDILGFAFSPYDKGSASLGGSSQSTASSQNFGVSVLNGPAGGQQLQQLSK